MKLRFVMVWASFLALHGCGSKEEKAEAKNPVGEKVKAVVTQPFTTYDAAKDALKASDNKTNSALEDLDKELNQ